jgi:hypothetical protein
LKHFASSKFWACFDLLPAEIQQFARRSFELLKQNPSHPSLQFKPICSGRFRSVRVGLYYWALGIPVDEGVQWFWIGSHADYDRLIR